MHKSAQTGLRSKRLSLIILFTEFKRNKAKLFRVPIHCTELGVRVESLFPAQNEASSAALIAAQVSGLKEIAHVKNFLYIM